MTIRHWQVPGLLCGHSPSERHAPATADDMVPAQWEPKLSGRQACQPKAISSTYNFISQFQGLKQRLEGFAFYRTLPISLKSTNLTSPKISVCWSNGVSCRLSESEGTLCHSEYAVTLGRLTLNTVHL